MKVMTIRLDDDMYEWLGREKERLRVPKAIIVRGMFLREMACTPSPLLSQPKEPTDA